MKNLLRRALSVFLCQLMVFLPTNDLVGFGKAAAQPADQPVTKLPLRDYLHKPYLELFELSPSLHFSAQEIDALRKALEGGEKSCVAVFKDHAKQYAWNAGYDPTGFTRFFDKIAMKQGYINGVSWFRTHPPFYQRMVDTEREILFLPQKSDLIMQTSDFDTMKQALTKVKAAVEKEEANQPTLRQREKNCEAPKKIEYQAGEPIEKLCTGNAQPIQTGTR